MEELETLVLEEPLEPEALAEAAACCKTGATMLRVEPEPGS